MTQHLDREVATNYQLFHLRTLSTLDSVCECLLIGEIDSIPSLSVIKSIFERLTARGNIIVVKLIDLKTCLLYTSDAADE